MSEHAEQFIAYLEALKERDRGALATLRHSLAFDPGVYFKAFPHIERFVGADTHECDARRLALYTVAGLFARHPQHQPSQSLAAALGTLMCRRQSANIEGRFIALLGADAGNIVDYLRQAVSLLAAKGIGLDYARLLDDLTQWMNPGANPLPRDRKRQSWARDFYRVVQAATPEPIDAESITEPTE